MILVYWLGVDDVVRDDTRDGAVISLEIVLGATLAVIALVSPSVNEHEELCGLDVHTELCEVAEEGFELCGGTGGGSCRESGEELLGRHGIQHERNCPCWIRKPLPNCARGLEGAWGMVNCCEARGIITKHG